MEVGAAFQAIARTCLRQLVDNLPTLRQRDPEGLYQAQSKGDEPSHEKLSGQV
jgi:hypothetical protein